MWSWERNRICCLFWLEVRKTPWQLHLCSPALDFYRMSPNVFLHVWRYAVRGWVWGHKSCWDSGGTLFWVVGAKPGEVLSILHLEGIYNIFWSGINMCFRTGKLIKPIPDIIWHFSLRWVTGTDFWLSRFLIEVSFTEGTLDCCSFLPINYARKQQPQQNKVKKCSYSKAAAFWGLGISTAFGWSAKPAKQKQKAVAPPHCCGFGLEHSTSVCVTQAWEQASLPCKPRRACMLMLNVILGPLSFWQRFELQTSI